MSAYFKLPLTLFFLSSFIVLFAKNALAEYSVDSSARNQLGLTVYNSGLAMIRDQREFHLAKQENEIALLDVSAAIMPETVALQGLQVREQNYDFDLLSATSLLQKHLGKKIRIARRSSESGETLQWLEATVLSINDGILLQMEDGRIEAVDELSHFQLVYETIPESLRSRPTLSLKLDQPRSGDQQINLSYLSRGLSWRSDYVMTLDNEHSATLYGWVTINNHSGVAYENAQLQLLAGDINLAADQPKRVMARMMTDSMAAAPESAPSQSLQGYHLYDIPFTTTLKNNQQKQIRLVTAEQIDYQRKLIDSGYLSPHQSDEITSKPQQFIEFKNSKPYLGIPLPAGTVRLYADDEAAQKQFVGEDRIEHSAVNDELKLLMGRAFDVTIKRSINEVRQISKKQQQVSRQIHINNGAKKAQTILIRETMPTSQWQIDQSTSAFKQINARSIEFAVTVPAESDVTLNYLATLMY